jgi:hypothetical protein
VPGEALALGLAWVVPIVRPAEALIGTFAPLVIALAAGYAGAKVLRPRSDGTHIDKR